MTGRLREGRCEWLERTSALPEAETNEEIKRPTQVVGTIPNDQA